MRLDNRCAAPSTFPRNTHMPKFNCKHCSQNIDAPASMSGTHANCPTCGGSIMVPGILQLQPPTLPLRAAETKSGSGSTGVITTVVSVIAVVILARACGSIVGRDAAERHVAERQIEKSNTAPQTTTVEAALAEFVRLASSGLPKMVDRITRLESVVIENGNTIVESYTITTFTKEELNVSDLNNKLRLKNKSEPYSSPKAKLLRDYNVKWVCRYYDKNNKIITSVSN